PTNHTPNCPRGIEKPKVQMRLMRKKRNDCECTEQLQKQKIKLYQERRRMRWMFMIKRKKS
ncbi:hypothetical protein, partial [Clostridium sp. KLE 1755]|uniref:hypothetical protein n=1 Tax=Clostridium sp. KLE 1755 TaxID=1226325 RepID=UPI001A9A60FD